MTIRATRARGKWPKRALVLSPSDNLGGTTVVAEAEAMMSLFSQFFRVVDLWAGKGTR